MLERESQYCVWNPKHHYFSLCWFYSAFSRRVIFLLRSGFAEFLSLNKKLSQYKFRKKTKTQTTTKINKLKPFFILLCTCGLKNKEINMWASLTLMFRKWEELRGVVSAAVFGTMLSLCMEDAKFSYTVPANLLPLILAFFSFLFFLSLVPLFFHSSLGFKWMPSPSLISTLDSCLQLQKNV